MAYLEIVDVKVTPTDVERGGVVVVSFKTKNSAGTLTTAAIHTKVRAYKAGTGTQLFDWAAVTTSPAGTHTYTIKNDVMTSYVEPGKYIVEIEARDVTGPPQENYKAKTEFWVK